MDEGECIVGPVQYAMLGAVVVHAILGFFYCVAWYTNSSWTLQNALRHVLTVPWIIGFAASIVWLVESSMCLLLATVLKPSSSIGTLLLIVTPLLYAQLTIEKMQDLKKMAEAAIKKELVQKQLEKAKVVLPPGTVNTSDIVFTVLSGVLLLIALIAWTFLGMRLLSPEPHE